MWFEVTDTKLSLVILTPSMIKKVFSFFNFSNSMISSTPNILNIIESNTVKSKTAFSFSSFIDSSSSSEWLRFSSAEYFIIDKNTGVIRAWYKFLNGMVSISYIERNSCEFYRFVHIFYHFLSSQIIIVTCKINNTIDAVCKHRMVVSSWNQIHWIIQKNLHWNTFRPFSPQSSLIITPKSISFSISGQNDRM